MTSPLASVFLVDDDAFMVFTLKGILRSGGYAVEAFEQPEALLERLSASDRGCVVLDLQMPGLNGLELQKALGERGVAMPLIFISGRADVPSAVAAMKRGAVDFLAKPIDPEELLAVVARALQKDAEGTAARAARELALARWAALSQREQEVCRLCARGLLNKQVATELGTRESTVQAQRASALKKLQMSSSAELVYLLTHLDERR